MPKIKKQPAIPTRKSFRIKKPTKPILPTKPSNNPSHINITSLPAEILLEIFDYVNSSDDLMKLTRISKSFSSLINNSKLAEKFTLRFDEHFHTREWIGSRKYSKIRIEEEKGIFSILKAIGGDLKHVTIDIRSIDLRTIARILNLCPNMKYLKFEDVKTHSFLDMLGNKELPKHDDVEIYIVNTTPNIFELFTKMKIKKLTLIGPNKESDFDSCYSTGDCRIAFTNFLRSQTILTDLTLENFKPPASLFNDNKLGVVPFRLVKLKVKNFRLDNANFYKFLENHRETIVCVDLDSRGLTNELITYLEDAPNFKEMTFYGNMISSRSFPRVEKLSAHFVTARFHWQQFFPNLKDLKIRSDCYLSPIFNCFENFKKLQKLEIFGSHFPNMRSVNIPTVKTLILRHVTCDYPKIFHFETANLEELTIDNCTAVWLPGYLRSAKNGLKSLTVANTNLNSAYRKYVEDMRGTTVKEMKFINCTTYDVGENFNDYVQRWRNKLKLI